MAVSVIKNTKLYDIIVRKVMTDKVYKISQNSDNTYCFVVRDTATKLDIKKVVELIYGVKVRSINTLNRYSLSRSFRGNRRSFNEKVAYVTLSSGSIDSEL